MLACKEKVVISANAPANHQHVVTPGVLTLAFNSKHRCASVQPQDAMALQSVCFLFPHPVPTLTLNGSFLTLCTLLASHFPHAGMFESTLWCVSCSVLGVTRWCDVGELSDSP